MPFTIQIPFYAFELNLLTGGSMIRSMTDKQVARMGQSVEQLAELYAKALQEKIIDQRDLIQLLEEYRAGSFYQGTLQVNFPKAKDGVSFPSFEVAFDCFFNPGDHGCWGIVPALGIEAFAIDEATLFKQLRESIRQDFIRKRKLQVVQDLVTVMWYESVSVHQQQLELNIPTLRESEKADTGQHERWLPKVAQLVSIPHRVSYGRKAVLQQFSEALDASFSRNILLVGPNGVGKTALVWELAHQRQLKQDEVAVTERTTPIPQIWETTASSMIKELSANTGWQDNIIYLCQELAATGDLLFVRNLMDLFEVGKYQGNQVSIAEYLQPYISRGEVNLISECTEEELAAIEIRRPSYLSFFQLIRLEEPTDELEMIILRKVQAIAQHQQVMIDTGAIQEVIRLQKRFMPYAGLPGKPIRFLESMLINESEQSGVSGTSAVIDRSKVIQHFCQDSGMPAFVVDPTVPMDVAQVRHQFNQNIFGQEAAVHSVVDLLASVKTALTRTGKPIASFLFVGPTGVGKTELAKVLAEFMFGSRDRLVRFDMSEFSSYFDVERLLGSNYFSEGLLTSAVRKAPFSVLLFDEIEKAHPSFYDLLLQVLSEGRLSDNQGKLVNFCSTIIIMTSNIGAARIQGGTIGWQKEVSAAAVAESFLTAVRQEFRPELFNRIDKIIPFLSLDAAMVRAVVDREINLFRKREGIRYRRLDLQIEDAVLDCLARRGYDSRYGARQLQRTIREELIIPLARKINLEDFEDQLLVEVRMVNEQVHILTSPDPLGLELLLEELEKTNYADHSSDLRRAIYELKENHLYVKFLSQLDQLERRKKKKKNKFWRAPEQVAQYTRMLEVKERVNTMVSTIEQLEADFSLACLQLKPYAPTLVDEVENWQKAFLDLKIELYEQLHPHIAQCHFGIYGTDLAPILSLYLDLFQQKNLTWTAQSLWFRERYYNEEITVKSAGATVRKKRADYLRHPFTKLDGLALSPPKPNDVCYGMEFVVTGRAALLYLQAEDGFQQWELQQGKHPTLYFVKVAPKGTPTPPKIHRKDFYKRQTIRRHVTPAHIRDNLLKINREYQKGELAQLLAEELDRLFELLLDEMLS